MSPFHQILLYFVLFFIHAFSLSIASGQLVQADAPSQSTYAPWETSFAKAMVQSRQSDRPILLVFNQSDSAASRKLVRDVLQTHSFARWSTDNVIKMEIDFPNSYQLSAAALAQNQQLLGRYRDSVKKLPTLVLVHQDGRVLGTWNFQETSVDQVIHQLDMLLPIRKRPGDLTT